MYTKEATSKKSSNPKRSGTKNSPSLCSDTLIRTHLLGKLRNGKRSTEQLLEVNINRQFLEDPTPQLRSNHAVDTITRHRLPILLEIFGCKHQDSRQLRDEMLLHGLYGLCGGDVVALDGGQDGLRCAGAGGVAAFGFHGMDNGLEAGIFGPETVDVLARFADGFVKLGGIETDDVVVGRARTLLLEYRDFKGAEQVLFVNTVHAFSLQRVFEFEVLGHDADAEDHG